MILNRPSLMWLARLAAIGACQVAASEDVTLWRENGPGHLRWGVVVPRSEFAQAHLEAMCKRILERNRNLQFIQLQIFAGRDDAYPVPKPNHISYQGWRNGYEIAKVRPPQIAEMIAIGGSATLRILDARGRITEVILQNSNPRTIQLRDGTTIEILHFGFRQAPFMRYEAVDVYVTSDQALSTDLGKAILIDLKRRLPFDNVFVHLRNDIWFIYQRSFPYFYPFGDNIDPPSEREHNQTRTIDCGDYAVGIKCSG